MLWIIIIYLFLFTESRILRFTIQIYNSIYETLPKIQDRIPILTTLLTVILKKCTLVIFILIALLILVCLAGTIGG